MSTDIISLEHAGRNLSMFSLGFIIFSIGGGHPLNDEVRFQIVNVGLSNPSVLKVTAWVLLLWFFIRYTQSLTLKNAWGNVRGKSHNYKQHKCVQKWIKKQLIKNNYLFFSFEINKFNFNRADIRVLEEEGTNKRTEYNLAFEGITSRLIKLWLYPKIFIKHPEFGTYVVPYILFLCALLSYIYRAIDNNMPNCCISQGFYW